jgi:hypothetical protein
LATTTAGDIPGEDIMKRERKHEDTECDGHDCIIKAKIQEAFRSNNGNINEERDQTE